MHRCEEISERLNDIISATYESQTNKETQPERIKLDNIDFTEIQSWFRSNNSFVYGEHLVCLHSGLVDERNQVNWDCSEEMGASTQRPLNRKNFDSCSFKRKRSNNCDKRCCNRLLALFVRKKT